jgi:hypothetical protein
MKTPARSVLWISLDYEFRIMVKGNLNLLALVDCSD